jgi:Fis family transcriptional regulator, factor for inversion stimulation protein
VKEELERLVLQMYRSGLRYSDAVREFQRTFLATVLRDENVNQVRAAKRLGIHRNTLRRQIHELELDIKSLRVARRRPPLSERALVAQKNARAKN